MPEVKRVAIHGLGKLGASMAAAMASRGLEVIGVDVNPRAVERLNAGQAPVQETDLARTIAANRQRLRATLDHAEAVAASDISFVIVPTPSDQRGAFSLQYAAWAFKEIGRALAAKEDYHLVVLTSTVLPGSTRYGLLPILERESGRRCGEDFGLCYSPEFIALGSVIRDFLHPDFTLVGEFDARSGEMLERFYARLMPDSPPCRRMSLENAELAKVALNAYVTMKITFANFLAELCERLPGGDVDRVSEALGSDSRIGRKYLTGALGYGGPCFPRDNLALAFIARELGVEPVLPRATDGLNRSLVDKLVDRFRARLRPGQTVAVLGLAYKPHSHVIEESQGLALARGLAEAGARVVAYDPLAGEAARAELGDKVLVLESIPSCLEQASWVMITNPDPAFAALGPEDFPLRPVTVVDFWRILAAKLEGREGIHYLAIGRGQDRQSASRRLAALWGEA